MIVTPQNYIIYKGYDANATLSSFINDTLIEYVDSNILSLPYSAFRSKTNLKIVTLANCTDIGRYAFDGCTSLMAVDIGNCRIVEEGAFSKCSLLATIFLDKCQSIHHHAFGFCKSLTTLYLPNCTYISAFAFNNCSNLSSVRLSQQVTLVNSNAFSGTPIVSSGQYGFVYVPSSLLTWYQTANNWSLFSSKIIGG